MRYPRDWSSRLAAANIALASFSIARIERRQSGLYVCWVTNGECYSKRWQCRGGQDLYATWSLQYPGGGTSMTALSQLIRWIRGKPVLSIQSWRYWAGEKVKLLRHGDAENALQTLTDAGYPQQSICVLCGERIEGPIDWWNYKGVSGPCCYFGGDGCRKKAKFAT